MIDKVVPVFSVIVPNNEHLLCLRSALQNNSTLISETAINIYGGFACIDGPEADNILFVSLVISDRGYIPSEPHEETLGSWNMDNFPFVGNVSGL